MDDFLYLLIAFLVVSFFIFFFYTIAWGIAAVVSLILFDVL